nr:N-acetylglucosamine-1-phosphodiester alpha-N-acetylglucosaminidase-like [Crassostrea gigas]
MMLNVFCFFSIYIAISVSDFCKSLDGSLKCCPGFVWNKIENRCKKCDAGKFGAYCEHECPYPWYGKQCLSKCNCSDDRCDPADGCNEWATQDSLAGHSTTLSYAEGSNEIGRGMLTTVLFETDNADTTTDTQISYEWLFVTYTIVPLCVIVGINIAALMFKHLRQRRKFVTLDAAYTVPTHQHVRHIYDMCDEGLNAENSKRENGQNQEDVPNSITDEDGYLTVVV